MASHTRGAEYRRGIFRNQGFGLRVADKTDRLRVRLWHGRAADDALDETREEHRRIYEAIVEGDPELARAAATAHIASGERWLRAQLASSESATG